MTKPKIVSIFSGVGGIDFGFEKAGFQTVFASDIWDRACESLKVNFNDCEVVCDDIVKTGKQFYESKLFCLIKFIEIYGKTDVSWAGW